MVRASGRTCESNRYAGWRLPKNSSTRARHVWICTGNLSLAGRSRRRRTSPPEADKSARLHSHTMSQGPGVGDQGSASLLAASPGVYSARLHNPGIDSIRRGRPPVPGGWWKVREACPKAKELRGGSGCALPHRLPASARRRSVGRSAGRENFRHFSSL
jgi:hypothetical protein